MNKLASYRLVTPVVTPAKAGAHGRDSVDGQYQYVGELSGIPAQAGMTGPTDIESKSCTGSEGFTLASV